MFLRFKRLMHFKHFTQNSIRQLADQNYNSKLKSKKQL